MSVVVLSVNVPINLRHGDRMSGDSINGGLKEATDSVLSGRLLDEEENELSFGIEVSLSGEGRESDASGISMGVLSSVGMTVLSAGMV